MSNPLISVVMAAYNEPIAMVQEAVDSILNQTYRNLELIVVVDNPENEELVNFLRGYGERIILRRNETNIGLPASLNAGIGLANGEIIARMDSDDVSLPNRLEVEYKFLLEKCYDLISSNITYIDEKGKDLNIIHVAPKSDKKLYRLLKHVNCMSHPTYLFRKEVFDKTYGYKEELKAAQDYEFVNHAMSLGFHIGFCTEVLLKYRVRNGNISETKNTLQRFITYYVRKAYVEGNGYDKNYINDCILGISPDYQIFNAQYKKYQDAVRNLHGLRKITKQCGLCVRYKYVRSILYHDFMYRFYGKW